MGTPPIAPHPPVEAAAGRRKFRRRPSTEPEHSRRVRFGKSWGQFNSEQARKLREGTEREQ